ncbi:hypothetical protein SDJN03_23005, partial [Cucurbita argyrosperma subsp. sororia]
MEVGGEKEGHEKGMECGLLMVVRREGVGSVVDAGFHGQAKNRHWSSKSSNFDDRLPSPNSLYWYLPPPPPSSNFPATCCHAISNCTICIEESGSDWA